MVGHDGDPAHLDELVPGSFLSVAHSGPWRIDRDVPRRPTATALARTYLEEHPPQSSAAFLDVSHVQPSGAVVPLARWAPELAKRQPGTWRWTPARIGPSRRELAARLQAQRPAGPPPGYVPWRKEQQALSFARELARPSSPAQQAPQRTFPTDPRGQAVMFNPAPSRPHWQSLRRAGVWSSSVREQLRGRSGVYAIREPKNPGTVLYVGESHTRIGTEARKPPGAKRRDKGQPKPQPLRWWKTVKRHFYRWTIPEWHKQAGKRMDEWVHLGRGDLDVAVWLARPADTVMLEGRVIAALRPLHNSLMFVPAETSSEKLEAAPF